MDLPGTGPVKVNAQLARVEYCVLPEDHSAAHIFTVAAEYRGGDRWAVCWGGRGVLGRDGRWSYESQVTSRQDDWLEQHRFSDEEAMRLAAEQATKIRNMGRTAMEVLEGDWV